MNIHPRDLDSGDMDRLRDTTRTGEDLRDIESVLGDLVGAQDSLADYIRHNPSSELAHRFGPLSGLRDVLDEVSAEHARLYERLAEDGEQS